jgi:hypothetical protein
MNVQDRIQKLEDPMTSKKASKSAGTTAQKTNRKKTKKAASSKAESRTKKTTKKDLVLELLRRKEGATTADIAKATTWQNHTVRGFLSGTLTKKMGLTVESVKNEGEERTYRITE